MTHTGWPLYVARSTVPRAPMPSVSSLMLRSAGFRIRCRGTATGGPGGVLRGCGVWVTVGRTRFGWRDTKPPAKQTQSVETARAPHGPCHPTCMSGKHTERAKGPAAWTLRSGVVWSRLKSPRHCPKPNPTPPQHFSLTCHALQGRAPRPSCALLHTHAPTPTHKGTMVVSPHTPRATRVSLSQHAALTQIGLPIAAISVRSRCCRG